MNVLWHEPWWRRVRYDSCHCSDQWEGRVVLAALPVAFSRALEDWRDQCASEWTSIEEPAQFYHLLRRISFSACPSSPWSAADLVRKASAHLMDVLSWSVSICNRLSQAHSHWLGSAILVYLTNTKYGTINPVFTWRWFLSFGLSPRSFNISKSNDIS